MKKNIKYPLNYFQAYHPINLSDQTNYRIKDIKKIKKKNLAVLDIGCSVGYFLFKMVEDTNASFLCGVDTDLYALTFANKISIKNNVNLSLFCSGADKLPFKDESFDVVICNHMLEHVTNPQEIIKEIKRVLIKGGIVWIGTPLKDDLFVETTTTRLFGYSTKQEDHVVSGFTFEELTLMLEKEGLKVRKKRYYIKFFGKLVMLIIAIISEKKKISVKKEGGTEPIFPANFRDLFVFKLKKLVGIMLSKICDLDSVLVWSKGACITVKAEKIK